jgi:hypothetical protein
MDYPDIYLAEARKTTKPSDKIAGLQAKVWKRDHRNKRQKC